jgi:hypothetical protein
MQAMPIRIFLILFILFLIHPSALQAAPEQRTALIIGNSTYSSGPLKNPVNDATDMAAILQKLGFKVILKKNANLETMEEAIEDFGNRLKRGGVGLFYYAGHGVQVNGVNYLIPIGAKINKESDVRFKAFDAGRVLAEMENANNGLNIVLLDACRDNPVGRSFRSASRGLAIVSSAPAGTFISYSTGAGQVARDGEGRNSPYTKALLQYVQEPGLTIEDVFKGVRQKLRKETGQVPWELSSLEGKFFFTPEQDSKTSATLVKDMEYLQQKKALEEEKIRIDKERQALEADKKSITNLSPSKAETPIGKRPIRFIRSNEGIIKDIRTGLEWYVGPNSDMTWNEAKDWASQLTVDGGGWRMPNLSEIARIRETGKGEYDLDPIFNMNERAVWTDTWEWAGIFTSRTVNLIIFLDGKIPRKKDSTIVATKPFAVRSRK